MRDSTKFPGLDEVEQLKKTLFKPRSGSRLSGFSKALSVAFDRLGFTKEFVDEKCLLLSERSETCDQIELNASQVDKVVKDVIWGMISTGLRLSCLIPPSFKDYATSARTASLTSCIQARLIQGLNIRSV